LDLAEDAPSLGEETWWFFMVKNHEIYGNFPWDLTMKNGGLMGFNGDSMVIQW
jgi:hypothetical protein